MFGGQDRELYLSQRGDEEHQGKIYRLTDGKTQYVTDFDFEKVHEYPGLTASAAGRIVNWGERFLSVYVGGRWHEHEASLAVRDVQVIEAGGKVLVSHSDKLYVIDEAGGVQKRAWDFGESIKVTKTPRIPAWGRDRILVLRRDDDSFFGSPPARLHAFEVNVGRQMDLGGIRRQLEKRRVVDFFPLSDGAVWLRTHTGGGRRLRLL